MLLVFLPVITVGTAMLNRDSEKRAMEDHKLIRQKFDLLKEVHGSHRAALAEITARAGCSGARRDGRAGLNR